MFSNMGRKIQALAVTICWIGIGLFVIIGALVFYFGFKAHMAGLMASGILILILGPLFSWISIFSMYAFGDLVANVQEIKEQLYQMDGTTTFSVPEEVPETVPEEINESVIKPIQDAMPESAPETAFEPEKAQDSSDDYTPDDAQKEKYYEKYFS